MLFRKIRGLESAPEPQTNQPSQLEHAKLGRQWSLRQANPSSIYCVIDLHLSSSLQSGPFLSSDGVRRSSLNEQVCACRQSFKSFAGDETDVYQFVYIHKLKLAALYLSTSSFLGISIRYIMDGLHITRTHPSLPMHHDLLAREQFIDCLQRKVLSLGIEEVDQRHEAKVEDREVDVCLPSDVTDRDWRDLYDEEGEDPIGGSG